MAKLVLPSSRYKTSYLEALREFQREGRYNYHDVDKLQLDFQPHVEEERQCIHDENIMAYRVPETIFWLVDDGEFIGRLEFRHELNDHLLEIGGHIGYSIRPSRRREGWGKRILELGVQKAREYDMDRVLLTCDPDNVASRKIIEKNGGKFENRVDVVRDGLEYHKLRFWIDVDSPMDQTQARRTRGSDRPRPQA
jgi:predicted acetyltransferase